MKPTGNLEYCVSGRLPFSQSQIPTHTGTVWSETFASVPWSFLIRPNANSHTHNLVLRPLPQFLGAFSQGQIPTHTGKVPLLAPTVPSFFFFKRSNPSMTVASEVFLRF
jgi:hypothetical protein